MSDLKKIILVLFQIALFITLIWNSNKCSHENEVQWYIDNMFSLDFKGKVTGFGLGNKTSYILIDHDGIESEFILHQFGFSDQNVEVGDSILNPVNSCFVTLKKKNGDVKVREYPRHWVELQDLCNDR